MKNAILIGGALAAVVTLQVVSYHVGVSSGRAQERYGKCLGELLEEVHLMNSYFVSLADKVKATKKPGVA